MGLFSKDIQTMDDLFLHGLQDVYYAENQIVKALPKMIDKATNRDLSKGLKDHLEETEKQIGRLDQVFRMLGQKPKGVNCPAIDGIIAEADDLAVRSPTRRCWTPPLWGRRRRSSTMRLPGTAPWSRGPTARTRRYRAAVDDQSE